MQLVRRLQLSADTDKIVFTSVKVEALDDELDEPKTSKRVLKRDLVELRSHY